MSAATPAYEGGSSLSSSASSSSSAAQSTPEPTPKPTPTPTEFTAAELYKAFAVYKRTFVSIDPFKDGAFLKEVLGLEVETAELVSMTADGESHAGDPHDSHGLGVSYNRSSRGGGADEAAANDDGARVTCARRMVLTELNSFELHFFESFVTPDGSTGGGAAAGEPVTSRSVGDWIGNWSAARGDLAAPDWTWDAFSLPSVTFYTPWIMPFVAKLQEYGAPFKTWRYEYKTTGTRRWMYSVLIAIPHSGLTLEVTSDQSLSGSKHAYFADIDAAETGACGIALKIAAKERNMLDVDWAHTLYVEMGGEFYGSRGTGLPDLIAVAGGTPASQPLGPREFVENVLFDTDYIGFNATNASGAGCDVGAVQFSSGNGGHSVPFWLRSVDNRAARDHASVAALEADVHAAHKAFLGFNRGWDRWVDMHIGLHVGDTSLGPLDNAVKALEAQSVPYHFHPSCGWGCSWGSIWTAAPGALGFEVQGEFSSIGKITNASLIDYCSPNSNGDEIVNGNDDELEMVKSVTLNNSTDPNATNSTSLRPSGGNSDVHHNESGVTVGPQRR